MGSTLKHSVKQINESTLKVDLSELAHSLVRELAMACKKVSIYSPSHPMAKRALERPFLILDRIGRYKQYLNFNIERGYLYLLGIRIKESIFSADLIEYMQLRDVSSILFERQLTMSEFSSFVKHFVFRQHLERPANSLSAMLKRAKINVIEVNSERSFKIFESGRQYRGDVDGDFSVKALALDQMGDDLARLAMINGAGYEALEELGIDFEPNVIGYLLPEKIYSLQWEKVRRELEAMAEQIRQRSGHEVSEDLISVYMSVFRLMDYHPDRDLILNNLDTPESIVYPIADDKGDSSGAVEIIKEESREQIDKVISSAFSKNKDEEIISKFDDAFLRLIRTGQKDKAIETINLLLDKIESPETDTRHQALNFLLQAVEQCRPEADAFLIDDTIKKIISRIDKQSETFEYSEFIWSLLKNLLFNRRFRQMADLMVGIAIRRKISDDVTIYDSWAVKIVFGNFDRPEIIRTLIDELVKTPTSESSSIKDILIAVGSETVALELSQIISHPIRQVRQQALKILAELGKSSLTVFSRILSDDAMFEREAGRHELPDSKWYVIRNSLFVLGSLADPEGLIPLRLRINDPDVRVRREIISTLEKIGNDDACDLAVVMTADKAREISEAATIVVGLIGNEDYVPLLIDTIYRNPVVIQRAISALGKIGGEQARAFLVSLVEDNEFYTKVQGSYLSKDDIWLAAIRALGQIGDQQSIKKIKEFKEKQPASQRYFFKNSPINKEISSILARSK